MRDKPERLREIIRFGIAEETNRHADTGLRVKRRSYSLQASTIGLLFLPIILGGLILLRSNGLGRIVAAIKKLI